MGEEPLALNSVALALGGARGVFEDVAEARKFGAFGGIIACNDIGAAWPEPLTAWVTLHAVKMKDWIALREANGFPPCRRIVSNIHAKGITETRGHTVRGMRLGATSGFFAAKVGLEVGFGKVVLCGIPMDGQAGHFFDEGAWRHADRFKQEWFAAMPFMAGRVRSMSGWTRDILGAPTRKWLTRP